MYRYLRGGLAWIEHAVCRDSACLSVTRSLGLSVDPRGSSNGSSLPSLLAVLAVDRALSKSAGKGGQATRARDEEVQRRRVQKRREWPAVQIRDAESGQGTRTAQGQGPAALSYSAVPVTVHIRPMAAHGRNVVAQHAALVNQKLQCSAANLRNSHSTGLAASVPGCCTIALVWLRVPEVRWGDVRPPVFPASLEPPSP
ncbi:hypothetical protein MKX08_005392 [Trichoderma sp. CBMAI-0020]|nr:hypothetical protein MKX08_005392 [Trichoderma sp. CBMAI-0020]